MTTIIKLYSYFRSSSAYRVRIALNLKGLDYDIEPVHLVKEGGEQFSEDFTKINAGQKVPVLEHIGYTIAQSTAIIEYLEENFPNPALYPTDRAERAYVRQLCEIINSDIQPLQNLSVLKKLVKDFSITDEQKNQWVKDCITRGFQSYEELLEKHSGRYSFGDTPTAADCFLVPQVYNANRFKVDMSVFPKIMSVNDNCLDLEAVQMAHPENQPDTPSN